MDIPVFSRLEHVRHRSLKKFCGIVHLRAGSMLACVVWAVLGLLIAIRGFQGINVFYSWLPSAQTTLFAAFNLIFAIVALIGIALIFLDVPAYIRFLSRAIWIMVFVILVDAIVNNIIFETYHSTYLILCIQDAESMLNENLQVAFPNGTTVSLSFNSNIDYYNCERLWEDELKFSIGSIIVMFFVYIYWAACIWSYSHKAYIRYLTAERTMAMQAAPPPMVPMGPAPDVPQTIFLNEKPSGRTSRKLGSMFSSLSSKRSSASDSIAKEGGQTDPMNNREYGDDPKDELMDYQGYDDLKKYTPDTYTVAIDDNDMHEGDAPIQDVISPRRISTHLSGGARHSLASRASIGSAKSAYSAPGYDTVSSAKRPFYGIRIGHDGTVRDLNEEDVDNEMGVSRHPSWSSNHRDRSYSSAGSYSDNPERRRSTGPQPLKSALKKTGSRPNSLYDEYELS